MCACCQAHSNCKAALEKMRSCWRSSPEIAHEFGREAVDYHLHDPGTTQSGLMCACTR